MEQKINMFYTRYEEARLTSNQRQDLVAGDSQDGSAFDFTKTLLLLDEVSSIIKQGLLLNPMANPGKKHLYWLKQELENEEMLFFEFLANERGRKAKNFSNRKKKSWQFYLRAIKNSIVKLNGLLAKTNMINIA